MRDSVASSPLPPSIEKAYHQKCIELKRRLNEIEEANDASRLRKHRLDRAIAKMRVNRAFLLDQLAKSQRASADDSDRSSSPPPTPQDRPPRMRRAYRRGSPSNDLHESMSSPPFPLDNNQERPATSQSRSANTLPMQRSSSNAHTQNSPGAQHSAEDRSQGSEPERHADDASRHDAQSYPRIDSLPNGTSVLLVPPGEPKRGPWTINDLHPRHRINPSFDEMRVDQQEHELQEEQYLPYDIYGRAVLTIFEPSMGKYRHVYPDDSDWVNPVSNGVRRDPVSRLPRRASERRTNVDRDQITDAARPRSRLENGRHGSGTGAAASGVFTAANR